jgi:hypothetical protein
VLNQAFILLADCYTPLLIIAALWSIISAMLAQGLQVNIGQVKVMLCSVILVYLLMWLDERFTLWPTFGMDYSSHTAIVTVFVSYFMLCGKLRATIALVSLLCYGALMVQLNYHSWLDILSTTIVWLPLFVYLQNSAVKRRQSKEKQSVTSL